MSASTTTGHLLLVDRWRQCAWSICLMVRRMEDAAEDLTAAGLKPPQSTVDDLWEAVDRLAELLPSNGGRGP